MEEEGRIRGCIATLQGRVASEVWYGGVVTRTALRKLNIYRWRLDMERGVTHPLHAAVMDGKTVRTVSHLIFSSVLRRTSYFVFEVE